MSCKNSKCLDLASVQVKSIVQKAHFSLMLNWRKIWVIFDTMAYQGLLKYQLVSHYSKSVSHENSKCLDLNYCYNILDGFYPPFFFRLDYVFFTAPFRISFYLSQCLPLSTFPYSAFLLLTHTTCLFSSSNHITSSYICYFQNIFSSPPYLTKG